jgi:imidazolonepropionase-like amidohydrolase
VVFTATGAALIRDGVVLIRGNRIEAVGPASEVAIPEGAKILDADGGLVIPGLINAHVHHGAPAAVRARFLAEGITTVCDLGAPWEEVAGYREREHEGKPVARGFFAGPFLAPPGGYPDGPRRTRGYNFEASGPDAVRRAVHTLADSGVHFIKIALDPGWNEENPTPFYSVEEARAIVDTALERGLRVRSHSIRIGSFPLLVEAGLPIVEHMPFPNGWPPEEKERELLDHGDPLEYFFRVWHPQYDTILTAMADAGMIMVPTASALLGEIFGKVDATPHERFVERAVLGIVGRYRDLGGVIALGNDYNGISGKEMFPVSEIRALLAAGLTGEEVLEAGTRHAAWVCGQEAELGTLQVGKLADLLVLEGDFLEDPEALERIRWVVLDGEVVEGSL